MSKKVLIRKQAGSGGIMYTREVGGRGQGGLMQDLAALRGGARGLNAQGQQSFIPGAQLGDAKPTGMQRLAAGANLAGRGLAAALTGLQTAYALQGGNVGALGSVGDTYAQNVQGLTANRPTEAQQAQNMATEAFNTQQQQMANDAMQQSAQQTMNQPVNVGSSSSRGPAPAGLPAPPVPSYPTHSPAGTKMVGYGGPAPTPEQLGKVPSSESLHPLGPEYNTGGARGPAATPPAPAATPPAPSSLQDLSQVVSGVSVPQNNSLGTATGNITPIPQPPQYGPNPPPLPPGYAPNYTGAKVTPLGANPRTPVSGQTDAQGYTIVGAQQTGVPDPFQNVNWQQPQQRIKSFATYVLDEFGDMLHKADPHVAGLLAFRVYMDKVMR